jgi:hypothetical protein
LSQGLRCHAAKVEVLEKKEKIKDVKIIEGTKFEKIEDPKFVNQKMIDDLKIIKD